MGLAGFDSFILYALDFHNVCTAQLRQSKKNNDYKTLNKNTDLIWKVTLSDYQKIFLTKKKPYINLLYQINQ